MSDQDPDPSKVPLPPGAGATSSDITGDPGLPTYQVGEFNFPACPAGTDPALAAGIGQYLETDAVKNLLLGQIQAGLMKVQHAAVHMPPGHPNPTPSRGPPSNISAKTMAQNQQMQGQVDMLSNGSPERNMDFKDYPVSDPSRNMYLNGSTSKV